MKGAVAQPAHSVVPVGSAYRFRQLRLSSWPTTAEFVRGRSAPWLFDARWRPAAALAGQRLGDAADEFEEEGALGRLEGFASEHGARFYGLPLNEERIVLERRPFTLPPQIGEGADALTPFLGGETLAWSLC